MRQKIRFIVNPISGIGKKNKLPFLIEKYLDKDVFEYDIVYTEFRRHGFELAQKAIEEEIDIVCAVGGDGSVNEVGSALIGSMTKMAIIPAGSGNGLARHLKIPTKIKKAIETINLNHFETVDTGIVNDTIFLGVTGFGFDALIAKKFDEYHTRGFFSYIKLVLKEYIAFKPQRLLVNDEVKDQIVICAAANGSQFGNGFCISPLSNIQDGELELFFLKKFPWYVSPILLFRFFFCMAHKSKYTETLKAKQFKIELDGGLAHIDGEPLELKKEITVELVPKSLNLLVGKKYK